MMENMVRRLCCILCVYDQMSLENYPLWNVIAYSNISQKLRIIAREVKNCKQFFFVIFVLGSLDICTVCI